MAPRFQLLISAALIFSMYGAAPARAEPITVTSGEAVVDWDGISYFNLKRAGDFALGGIFVSVPSSPQEICFTGCPPGTSVDFSGVFGGPEVGSLGSATGVTIDGVSYTGPTATLFSGLSDPHHLFGMGRAEGTISAARVRLL